MWPEPDSGRHIKCVDAVSIVVYYNHRKRAQMLTMCWEYEQGCQKLHTYAGNDCTLYGRWNETKPKWYCVRQI